MRWLCCFHRGPAILLLVLLALAPLSGTAAPRQPAGWPLMTLPAAAGLHLAPPLTKTSTTPKLDTAMAELAMAAGTGQALPGRANDLGLRLAAGRVQAEIVVQPTAAAQVSAVIAQLGGQVTGNADAGALVQAWLPAGALLQAAALDTVIAIRRPSELVEIEPGISTATSEGLAAMNAPAWHAAGQRGAGVAVAVIDGGFQGYQGRRGSDLPANVVARNFVDGESDAQVDGTTNHGTACAEIVADIAPGATIYLVKIRTLTDLSEAVAWLITQRVDIISTSLGFYNAGPGDGTGPLADLVRQARAAGIFWATAAGNERLRHWGGSFSDPDGDRVHNFSSQQEVNFFGPGDGRAYAIPAGVPLVVFIRWDDWAAVDQDYDLLLVRYNGSSFVEIARSQDFQTGAPGQRPTEAVFGVSGGGATAYGFVVVRAGATRNVHFEMFVPSVPQLDKSVAARSLAGPADSPDALTAAAVDVRPPYPQEPYSSEGPANGPGGAAGGGALKPDLAAYANVTTGSAGPGGFNGTSAATPHVAGAAALLLGASPGSPPAQLGSQLRERALDQGAAGPDPQFGSGRLHLGAPGGAGGQPTISIADSAFPEGQAGNTLALFIVTLSAASTSPVSVTYATTNGTATAPSDYTAVPPSSLSFAPGETSKLIEVQVHGDTQNEPTESFQVVLSAPAGATIADDIAVGTIINDDSVGAQSPRAFIPLAAAVPRAPAPDPWETISGGDFEQGFPAGWSVTDDNGGTGGAYTWARRNCRAFEGSFSGWAVGGGANGAALNCGSNYPNLALTRMVYGPFSLAGVAAAELRYKLWLQSELNYDGMCALASLDGRNFYGSCATGSSPGWIDRRFDLANVYQLGNLLGKTRVWVALGFTSDSSVARPEGGYVDNIVLRRCAAGCGASAQPAAAPADAMAEIAIALPADQPPVFPERNEQK